MAEEVPAVNKFAGAADVCAGIDGTPGLSAVDGDDGVDLPAFEQLSPTLDVRDSIRQRQGKAVAHIEVAAGILTLRIHTVHGQAGAGAEIPVSADIVEAVGIGVAHQEAESVIIAARQSQLQAVVVRSIDVPDLIDLGEERELGIKGTGSLFITHCPCRANRWIVMRGDAVGPARSYRRLINVTNPEEFRTVVTDISCLEGDFVVERVLHIDVPVVDIGSLEVLRDAHDRAWSTLGRSAVDRSCKDDRIASRRIPVQLRPSKDTQVPGDVAVT